MRSIEHIYVDGKFVVPDGNERLDLFNPATEEKIGDVRLGNADDARAAVEAAKRAFPAMATSTQGAAYRYAAQPARYDRRATG